MDHEIVDTAVSLTTDEHGTSDNEDKPLDERGFEYIDGYNPSESALVPTPPFTHLKYASSDGPVYFKAKAEQGIIELTEYTHTISSVAESTQEYEQYLRDDVLATNFSSGSLPDGVQKIVNELVGDSGLYHETPELSESYQTVLRRLGLADIEPPEKKPHSYESHGSVYFSYENKWYATALSISYKSCQKTPESASSGLEARWSNEPFRISAGDGRTGSEDDEKGLSFINCLTSVQFYEAISCGTIELHYSAVESTGW